MVGRCDGSYMCLCRKDRDEYQLLHSIHSVRSQLRSDLKAGSKFIQTKITQVSNICAITCHVCVCSYVWEGYFKFK